jgi:aspartate-semialdehyde dehydrogenase
MLISPVITKKDGYVVAVVGATGAVGNEMVSIMEERNFPAAELRLFASERSLGKSCEFKGEDVPVDVLTDSVFEGIDIAFFSAGSERSKIFAPLANHEGCVVIDTSSAWRADPAVPLVVPEVNSHDLTWHNGIIANPTCSAIQMAVVLKPLHDAAKIKRVVVTTFQAVSGSGKRAMEELFNQCSALMSQKDIITEVYPYRIAFNCLPHIDVFQDNGYTEEEIKIIEETMKIFDDDSLKVTATSVRVPVFRGHSESLNIETEKKLSVNEVRAILSMAPGIIVFDAPQKNIYPQPLDAAGRDEVFVGRIREDKTIENGINLWCTTDNLRKGAALNAVQIAEKLITITYE